MTGEDKYYLSQLIKANEEYEQVKSLIERIYNRIDQTDQDDFYPYLYHSMQRLGLDLENILRVSTKRPISHTDLKSIYGDRYQAYNAKLEKLNRIWSSLV